MTAPIVTNNKYFKFQFLMFCRFPKESTVRANWAKFCGISVNAIRPSDCLCQRHFKKEDLPSRSGEAGRVRLKHAALPVFFGSKCNSACTRYVGISHLFFIRISRKITKTIPLIINFSAVTAIKLKTFRCQSSRLIWRLYQTQMMISSLPRV